MEKQSFSLSLSRSLARSLALSLSPLSLALSGVRRRHSGYCLPAPRALRCTPANSCADPRLLPRPSDTPAYVSIRQHASAYGCSRGPQTLLHTSACVSMRQHTAAPAALRHSCIRQHTSACVSIRLLPRPSDTPAYVSIRQHASAYVSIRQLTSAYVEEGSEEVDREERWQSKAYVSIRPHASAYVRIRPP
jgi:hypothetical protein